MPRKSNKKLRKIPTLTFQFSDLWTVDYRFITALLIALPLLVYWQVYDFDFLWDDAGHLAHPFLSNPSWQSFIQLFSQPFFGMYIPVTYFFWGDLKAFADLLSLPLNSVLHLSNVLLHIINGLLVFAILRQFIASKWAVLIGALFFLLHPIQVESVAWTSEFRILLAFTFSFSALYFYLKNQTKLSFLPPILFTLALLSKPSAVVLVLFIFAINYFHYGLKFGKNLKIILPFALLALAFTLITDSVQAHPAYMLPVWQRPFAWLDSMVFYLFQLIFPLNLGAYYGLTPKFIASQWWFYPLAFLPLALGVFIWKKRQIYPFFVLTLVLFVAGFFPTSGFVSFVFQGISLTADRYLYFSMFAVALLIAFIFNTDKIIRQGLIIGVLLIFTALSAFRQIPIWENPLKLWSHSQYYSLSVGHIDSYADSNLVSIFYQKGTKLHKKGQHQAALQQYDKAIQIYAEGIYPTEVSSRKNISNTFNNKGVILLKWKRYQPALENFIQAIQLEPKDADKHANKIRTLLALKQCKKARKAVGFASKNIVRLPKSLLVRLQKNCPNR